MNIRIVQKVKSLQWLQIIATLSGSLVKFSAGLMVGWASPSLPKLSSPESVPQLTPDEGFMVGNALNIGYCVAIPIVALTADIIGRRNGILLCAPTILLSWFLVAYVETFELLCLARFLGGIGTGYGKTVISLYTSEIATPEIRGALGAATSLMTRCGMLFIFSVGPYVSITLMALISSTFTLLMFVTFFWMPQSPYYLLQCGKVDEAQKSLELLRKKHNNIKEEFIKIQESIALKKPMKEIFKKLLCVPSNRKGLIIVFVLFVIDQFSGMSAIIMYSQTIFERAGTKIPAEICSIVTLVIQILSSCLCIIYVDRFGRRPMLIVSGLGMAFTLATLSVYFYLDFLNYDLSALTVIPLMSLVFYHMFFMIGIGSLPFIIQSELFPTDVKALAISLGGLLLAVSTVIVTKIFQVLTSYDESAAFGFFSICTFLGVIFITCFVPETKGLSLEDIQKMLCSDNDDVDSKKVKDIEPEEKDQKDQKQIVEVIKY
ncbi:facilitated trehalose transporter Tret1-like [Chrysoperla carnea]|uniref:facilitated trehalose transporter Tret1-like n=1 Tax=Chrysoperla carnea TaxID=189513 RepID=UPI001D07F543|nr:facilitated trehalose transporter Tret1-like [Chrysoperla carnea]